jgi:hypothetical protein
VLIIIVQRTFEDRHPRWKALRKKALDSALLKIQYSLRGNSRERLDTELGYIGPELLPELPLNRFHLVFEP